MLNVAILGLGWWGQEIVRSVHGNSDQIELALAADLKSENVKSFANLYNLRLCGTLDNLLESSFVDAIILATPHSQHVEQIISCAKAGKHVFSEKPLALSLSEARRAVDACDNHNMVFGLGTDRRFLPAVVDLKNMVEGQQLGEILQVEVQYSNDNMSRGVTGRWRFLDSEAPGAGMTGPGLHALDALINLLGPVAKIAGNLRQPFGKDKPVDSISLMLEFECGARGLLGCVRGCPKFFRLAVYGTEGWAEIREFNELHYHISGQKKSARFFDPGRATLQTLEYFAKAVEQNSSFPVTTTSMLQTVAAFEAVIKSFETDEIVKVTKV